MGRYAFDQEETLSADINCPECKHVFSVDIVVGINKPDVEIDIKEIKE